MKKIIALLIVALMVMSLTATATEIKFSDVAETDKAYDSIYKLVEAGILVGDGDGTFRPNDGLTRAEFCKIINLIFGYTEEAETNFKDVKATDWYYKDVLIAKKAGYIAGYGDDTFRGENMLTREETCVIISRVAKLYKLPYYKVIKDPVSSWAKEYVEKVLSNRLMSLEAGDIFRATEKITRAEMAMVSSSFVVKEKPEEKPDETEEKTENETSGVKPSGSGSSSGGGSSGGSSSGGSSSGGSSSGGSSSGGSSSGGSSSGGSSVDYASENAEMISSLNSVINSFKTIEFTDDEKEIVDAVLVCVNDALGKANSMLLTNEYIRETYAEEIDETQAMLNAMPEEEQRDFSTKVILNVEDKAYDFLMDFFFPED